MLKAFTENQILSRIISDAFIFENEETLRKHILL